MNSSIGVDIAIAVAAARGVDPTALEDELHEYVDIDAIDQLLDRENGSWHVSFDLSDCIVTVTSEGDVTVEPLRNDDRQPN